MSDERYALPEGWVQASLGTVCAINPRHEKGAVGENTPISFVPMAAVDYQTGAISGGTARPYGEIRKGFTHFAEGDVLFARITPCMENGKVAVARGLVNGLGCGTTEFHVLRPLGGILPEYVHRYLRQESFRRAAAANMSGTAGQLRVSTDYMESVEIPLAPVAEQRRIVAKIEALFEQSRAARQALDRIPPLLKKFRQAVLAAAFQGDLTRDWREQNPDLEPASTLLERIQEERLHHSGRGEWKTTRPRWDSNSAVDNSTHLPDQWVAVPISELLHYSRSAAYGILQPGPNIQTGVPMVRVCDIVNGTVLTNQLKRISPGIDAQYERTRLQGGEVLVTLVGTIGRTAVVPWNAAGFNVARAVAVLPLCSYVLPSFLHYCLEEPRKNIELIKLAREVARKTLNLGILKNVVVPLAPLAEQKEIVHRMEAFFRLADAIEMAVEGVRRRADKLDQSILVRAFRGELVPQDPNEESASVLLDRIRADRPKDHAIRRWPVSRKKARSNT